MRETANENTDMKVINLISFFKDFIYLFMRDTERQTHRQREKQASYGEGRKEGRSTSGPRDHDLRT